MTTTLKSLKKNQVGIMTNLIYDVNYKININTINEDYCLHSNIIKTNNKTQNMRMITIIKLLSLGFIDGAKIEVLYRSIFGGLSIVRINNHNKKIALGCDELSMILVQPL